MELSMNNGLLGEFDYVDSRKVINNQPVILRILAEIGSGLLGLIFLIILLVSLGSCLGCSSCIEICNSCGSACSCGCGMCSDCGEDLHSCGTKCRKGCGCSCSSCGDDDSSSDDFWKEMNKYTSKTYIYKGYNKYNNSYDTYRLTISYYDGNETNRSYYFDTAMNEAFFEFYGFYEDSSYNSPVAKENLQEGKVYYSRWEEIGKNEVYTMYFQNAEGFVNTSSQIRIGEQLSITGLGIADKEGYVFKGIYYDGVLIVDSYGRVQEGFKEFHAYLYDNINQFNHSLTFDVVYEPLKYNVEFRDYETNELLTTVYQVAYNTQISSIILDQEVVLAGKLNGSVITGYSLQGVVAREPSYFATQSVSGNMVIYVHSYKTRTITFKFDYDGDLPGGETSLVVPLDPNQNFLTFVGSNINYEVYVPLGFTFIGWYTSKSFNTDAITDINQLLVDPSITVLYARIQGDTYQIKYYDILHVTNNTPIASDQYVTSNQTKVLLTNEQVDGHKGYTFKGWREIKWTSTTQYEFVSDVIYTQLAPYTSGEKYLLAYFEPNKYKVSLDTGSATLSKYTYDLSYNEEFTLPVPNGIPTGKSFYGYKTTDGTMVTDKNGNSLGKFNEALINSTFEELSNGIWLNAEINVISYTVELYSGESLIKKFDSVSHGSKVSYSEAVDTPLGMQFVGWDSNKASTIGHDLSYFVITEDTKLYAIFNALSINISFENADPSVVLTLPNNQHIAYKTEADSLQLSKPSYTASPAYEFVGYYFNDVKVTDANGVLLIRFDEGNLGISFDTLKEGITLKAKSALKEYTVTFYDGTNVYAVVDGLHYSDKVTKPAVDPDSKYGYSFVRWIESNDAAYVFDKEVTSSFNLYAQYSPRSYNVTLAVDQTFAYASSVVISPNTKSLTYDSDFTLPVPVYDNDAYYFAGYYIGTSQITDSEGKSLSIYKFNTNIPGVTNASDVTFYAKYNTKVFKVSYIIDNKEYSSEDVTYGATATEIGGKNKDGYRFMGWYLDNAGTNKFNFSTAVTQDYVLYGIYSNKVTIRLYDEDGITVLKTYQLTYGNKLEIKDYTYSGPKEFLGWYLLNDGVRGAKVFAANNSLISPDDYAHILTDIDLIIGLGE